VVKDCPALVVEGVLDLETAGLAEVMARGFGKGTGEEPVWMAHDHLRWAFSAVWEEVVGRDL
jgi:hypothetical protein